MDVMRSRNLTPRRKDAKGNREKKRALRSSLPVLANNPVWLLAAKLRLMKA
jgi:hypothetical protein